jgi:hypothetical protein
MSKKRHRQDEHFKINGHWWLPPAGAKVAGELCYTEGALTLSLFGGLNEARIESPFSATPESTKFPIIFGETLNAVPITVLESFYTYWKPDIKTLDVRPGTLAAIRSSRLYCGKMLEGVHLSSPDDLFSRCRIEIPFLEDWLGETPFDADFGINGESVKLEYSRPLDQTFRITALGMGINIVHTVRPPGLPFGNSPKIKHRTYIELIADKRLGINEFADRASEFVGMLSILYGGSLLSRRVSLLDGDHASDEALLFYPRHKSTSKKFGKLDFVLRFENVATRFGELLDKWLVAPAPLKRVRRMLLASERKPSNFIEFRFLPLIHAAEILSNEGSHAVLIPKAEYKAVRQKMLGSLPAELPAELVESIKQSLGHANSNTLRRKLLALLEEMADDTCKLFCVEKETFIKAVVFTRNHFTHYSTEPGQKILQGVDLHWAIRKLSLMLRLILLMKAGVPESVLQTAIQSHIRLSRERHVWQRLDEDGSVYDGLENE